MSDVSLTAYDQVPYPGSAYVDTHPDRLAVMASLAGLQPAPPARCRVLEIGCGDGANLVPMALALPHSRFTGIDLAGRPLQRAQALAEALGLANIQFEQGDLAAIGPGFGSFDYIIAHGVYSWVPEPVRDRLLAVCAASLAPDGVAFVSYNTLPGGHLRQLARGMMRFHVEHLAERGNDVAEARALLQFVAGARPQGDAVRQLLESELQRIDAAGDGYVYHDDLAETNTPVYFHEFLGHAAAHGLRFLAEADDTGTDDSRFAPGIMDTLRALTGDDDLLRDQYLDFVLCRKFRRTLLCHERLAPRRGADQAALAGMHVAGRLAFDADADTLARPGEPVVFRGSGERAVTVTEPQVKQALAAIAEAWPASLAFAQLQAMLPGAGTAAPGPLASALLAGFDRGLLALHLQPPAVARTAGEYPLASALARWQAGEGTRLTTLLHTHVELEGDLARRLVALLDGRHDRAALVAALADASHTIGDDRARLRQRIAADLDTRLDALAVLGLLQA